MSIKSKFLLFLVAPFLFFGHDKCNRPTTREVVNAFQKSCKFVKTVRTRTVTVGEKVIVDLYIENLSDYDVDDCLIQKETRKGDFLTIGKEYIESGRVKSCMYKQISYSLVPLRPGSLVIPPSRITHVRVNGYSSLIPLPSKIGFSNSVKLNVRPFGISIKQVPCQTTVVMGEKFNAKLEVKNTSPIDFKNFRIQVECEEKDFIFLKKLPEDGCELKRRKTVSLPYTIIPLSPGNKTIKIKISKIKFKRKNNSISSLRLENLSSTLNLSVKHPNLSIYQAFEKNDLKLMEKVRSILTITNDSKVTIEGFEHTFQGDFDSFRLVSVSKKPGTLLIPPGERRSIFYEFHAVKVGTFKPGDVFVSVSKLKMHGRWILSSKKPFASAPIPPLHIAPKRYYHHFALRVIGIALLINVLIVLFRVLINSFLVEFMFIKMILGLLLAVFISQSLLLSLTGLWWLFRTMPPPVMDLAAILAGSVCLSFIFGLIPGKNLAKGSSISGFVLGVVAISIFTGYKTYHLQDFLNFPLSVSIGLFFLSGWAINLWIFRNQKTDRRKKQNG